MVMAEPIYGNEIAIIGMSGVFPGARDTNTFWENLRNGVESIKFFSEEELLNLGVAPDVLADPNYVKAASFLDDPEAFDAAFFGVSHREAEITDPQHRVLLQCAWAALEDAAYNPETYGGRIGTFAGATINTYLLLHLAANPDVLNGLEQVQINIANAGDFLATRIAYKLNLKGPAYTLQSACSTSLVAVQVACESLLSEQCDMALAGGVSVNVSFQHGYRYLEGGMTSPDGHCRPFDADAQGTIFGSGAGMVVLKRLEEALADGDHIYAVILGAAINNDGSLKVGYTAPSVVGQSQVIAEALANAGVDASTIGYVETHGTGTALGDPVEIQALTKAFRTYTDASGYCAIGSVKSNIGHLDAAAGIAGLIKTALALKHKQLPPSLHFRLANPNIDFESSPFYVNKSLKDWEATGYPRRAGISAFGVGGSNAHVVLQEAPAPEPGSSSRPFHLLTLSARTETLLTRMSENLVADLQANAQQNLADVAYTLQAGRQPFSRREFLVARDLPDALEAFRLPERRFRGTIENKGKARAVTFLFPGQGAQYVNMGRQLYEDEFVFSHHLDRCAEILTSRFDLDLLSLMYPKSGKDAQASRRLQETAVAQPALFIVEYALAQLWLSWGIQPHALLGHSIGEYVAACLAGVFSVEDALHLVVNRARLMQNLFSGAMLAVPLSEFELEAFLNHEIAIAAINGPGRCTVAGPQVAIERLESRLDNEGVSFRRLQTSHAFHSPMMEPILEPFLNVVARINLRPPQIPYLSNVTGTWITAKEATAPEYWARHIRATVRFAENLAEVLSDKQAVLLEVGPGQTLTRLARQHPVHQAEQVICSTLRHPEQAEHDVAVALTALGQLWLAGAEPDWTKFYERERRKRVPLPTYPFARDRHWVEAAPKDAKPLPVTHSLSRREKLEEWFYTPSWQRILLNRPDLDQLAATPRRWLLLADQSGIATALGRQLKALGQKVTFAHWGSDFHYDEDFCTLNPKRREDYYALVSKLIETGEPPDKVIHLWSITGVSERLSVQQVQQRGFHSLNFLSQALAQVNDGCDIDLQIVANHLFALTAQETIHPEKATLMGCVKVIPHEFANIRCQVLDMTVSETVICENIATQILEASASPARKVIAFRGAQCWEQISQALPIPMADKPRLTSKGVYLMTGGLLEVGIEMAEYLAKTLSARLVLIEETPMPSFETWDAWLATHGTSNTLSQRILRVQQLMALGADVMVLAIDPADGDAWQEAVTQAVERFGPLNGVIHNARLLGERSFRTIEETGVTESDWQFIPKIYSTLHLARAIAGQDLDFCLLNSSLSSLMGGAGMVSYAAANSFLDAFARQQNHSDSSVWISVNWDAWLNTQMTTVSPEWAETALSRDEGIEVFRRILGTSGVEQVIVSTIDLTARLQRMEQRHVVAKAEGEQHREVRQHPRPDLSTAYVPPTTDRERAIAEIWQKALGIEKPGVMDNFFELGGDSLLAIQTAAELKKAFNMDIPVVTMYEGLTIRSLAKLLDELQQEQVAPADSLQSKTDSRRSFKRQMLQQQQRARRTGHA
jgi:acyl transferase domain-containing protein